MKILELTRLNYPSLGGMEKFVNDRLKIYQSLKYNYRVITTNTTEKQLANSKRVKGVKYLHSYTPYVITPKLQNVMNSDYDILSVNEIGYFYSDYAIRKAFKDEKKIILTPHYFFHTNKYKLIKGLHSKYILPKTLKKIDKLICFTEIEKRFWVNKFPFISSKVEVIPHYFSSNKSAENLKIKNSEKFFLYVGRGEKNKRIDLLIKAFSQLKTEYKLYLTVDKDELSKSIQNIVRQRNNIHLLGRVSEDKKNNLLKHCVALVFPTDYEAFGIVNLEASSYKKPLIISHLNIFENILNRDGVLYFENNIESIKEKIIEFLELSLDEKERMGELNYENLERFSFEKIKHKYEMLINCLVSSS